MDDEFYESLEDSSDALDNVAPFTMDAPDPNMMFRSLLDAGPVQEMKARGPIRVKCYISRLSADKFSPNLENNTWLIMTNFDIQMEKTPLSLFIQK